jgi:VCBS repeat-containing protein
MNDSPTAAADAKTAAEDVALTFPATDLVANDAEGPPNEAAQSLTVVSVQSAVNGTVALATGTVTFTPAANYNGPASFTYTVRDDGTSSGLPDPRQATGTVSVTVTEANDPPTAVADAKATDEDTALTFPASDLLANDSKGPANESGQTLSVVSVDSPANGTVVLSAGNVTFTPAANYTGPASFRYTIRDNGTTGGAPDAKEASATVDVSVSSVNDAPAADSQSVTTAEDTAKPIILAASDVDSVALTYTVVAGPSHGTLSGTAPNLTYTPAANYNGADSFTYKVNDGTNDSNIATVTITVTPVNDVPVAPNQNAATDEDTATAIVLNASDVDSDSLTYAIVTGPSHGALSGSAPNLTYTPAANYNGPDSFTYRADDGSASSNLATITITVASVNDAPIALANAYETAEDTPVTVAAPGVLGNDTDIDSPTLTGVKVGNPNNGAVTLNANGSFTYTPNANYNGADSFTYKANDGTNDSNVATVTITVTPVNDAPSAVNDDAETPENVPVDVDVLANDMDVEGSPLTVASFSQGAHGSVMLAAGKLRYTPAPGFNGTDSFTYRASDSTLVSDLAAVTIDVGAVNDAPVANDQGVTTAEDTAKEITLIASDADSDPLSYAVIAAPGHGTLSGTAPNLTYTPAANYNGADAFTFRASDGTAGSDLATVTITVTPVNDAPVAQNGNAATAEDTPTAIVLDATDVESASLSYIVVAGPSRGELSGTAPNLTYTPGANYHGPDWFTYRANDGTDSSNVATLAINVAAVNDPPIALGDAFSVEHGGTLAVGAPGVLGNDADVESGLTAVVVTNPSSGTLSLNANGSFTYTPSVGFSGTDSFTYKARDGALDSNVVTVMITVAQAPPPPPADEQPPTDPVIRSTSHALRVASTDRTIDLTWSGATDNKSGVDGFSFHWDKNPVSVPDTVKDAEETATGATSPALSNGSWYFHLRTRDNAGNWTATRHLGPFVIAVHTPQQVRCVVPNLKGKTVAQARRLLAAGRCALGRVTRAHSRLARAGRIVQQNRRPGARLPRGTKVGVVVSLGPRR